MRAQKTVKNVVWGFVYEAVVLICGFILPRLILTSFGSEYNGITGAVRQFLQVIALFQAGIGGVTMAALYKPLAENDIVQISIIVKSTESFMRKVVLIFLGFVIILACGFPFLFVDEFDWFFSASLVLIMSLSTCAQYFFGRTYQFLLNADQHQRMISIVDSIKIIANTAISAVMINFGYGIRSVMLTAATVYVIAPLFISVYTKKKYRIINNIERDNSVIEQRWDNFGQQVANFVNSNSALVILSFFSNVYEISVYTVYKLVINGVYGLFAPLTKGVNAAFGNMLARKQYELLKKNLRIYEQVVFVAGTFLFTVVIIMGLSFVGLYTTGVTDVDYNRPAFLVLITAATMLKCFRIPYEGIANAAGHFRQTRNPAFIEAAINITISISLVFHLGVIGVAIGSLTAYMFRTVRFASYISQNLIRRSIWFFFKRLLLSAGCTLSVIIVSSVIPLQEASNFQLWIMNSVLVSIITITLIIAIELIFYWNDIKELTKLVKGVIRKRKPKKIESYKSE